MTKYEAIEYVTAVHGYNFRNENEAVEFINSDEGIELIGEKIEEY